MTTVIKSENSTCWKYGIMIIYLFVGSKNKGERNNYEIKKTI